MNPTLRRELVEFLQESAKNPTFEAVVQNAWYGTTIAIPEKNSAYVYATSIVDAALAHDKKGGDLILLLRELSKQVNDKTQINHFIQCLDQNNLQAPINPQTNLPETPASQLNKPESQVMPQKQRSMALPLIIVLVLGIGIILGIAAPRLGTLLEATTPTPSLTPTITPTPTPRPPTATRTPRPTSTPTPFPTPIPLGRLLFEEDFEDGSAQNIQRDATGWQIVTLEDGNSVFQVSRSDWSNAWFGSQSWRNYLLEYRFKMIETGNQGDVVTTVRVNRGTGFGISLSYKTNNLNLHYVDTSWAWHSIANTQVFATIDRWYTLRFLANETQFSVWIDDRLITEFQDERLPSGYIEFGAGINTKVLFDNIRVWSLEP